jgi:hypothetical protein
MVVITTKLHKAIPMVCANNTLFEDLRIFLCRSSEPPYISGLGDLLLFHDPNHAH